MTAQDLHDFDVLIIGSGISSLTCGLLLAKAGKRVGIVERYEKAGGYLHCFERYGHRFDTGAHYSGALNEGEPFHALLTYLGVYSEDLFVPLADDGFDVFRFRDFELKIPRGYEPLIAGLSETFPDDAAAIRTFFERIRAAALSFSTYNFANIQQNDEQIGPLLDQSLESVVTSLTTNPRLQSVLYAHCALHGVAPADVSIGMHSLLSDSLIRGAWGFKHGGEYLVQRYVDALTANGAQVIKGRGVAALHTEGRKITEVVLDDGSTYRAPVVISGIHPKATFRMLRDFKASPAFATRLENIDETVGLLGVYAVARDPSLFDRDRNYYYFDWSEPEAFARLRPDRTAGGHPVVPRAAFLCRADRVPSAPVEGDGAGLYPLSVHAPAAFSTFAPWQDRVSGRKPRAYYAQKLGMAAATLDFVDEFVPGFRRSIVKYDVSTPLSNLRYNGSEQGTAYGIYHSIRNTGARSLGPRTHVENLLLTGQNSLFPGMLGAAVSGLRTAGNLIGIKNIIRDLGPLVKL